MLNIIHQVPDGFIDVEPSNLHTILDGPTLIHLDGTHDERLFVSILLHGNEVVGLRAIQKVLRRHQDRQLPRGLSIFVGNVEAARYGVRRLEHQPDFNRVWPGGEMEDSAERQMTQRVFDEMRRYKLFASVDLHNNMGLNPHYACVNRIDNRFLQLANLFSRTVVYFIQPKGVQSMAFADLCPSTTLECGQAGSERGEEHAAEFVDACLHLSHIPDHPISPRDIDLFHTVAIVKVPATASLGVGDSDSDADIVLIEDLEHLNFRELQIGTILASTRTAPPTFFEVRDERGEEVSRQYLAVEDGKIRLLRSVMPSMLTINEAAIRQDCLCYFMERYYPGASEA